MNNILMVLVVALSLCMSGCSNGESIDLGYCTKVSDNTYSTKVKFKDGGMPRYIVFDFRNSLKKESFGKRVTVNVTNLSKDDILIASASGNKSIKIIGGGSGKFYDGTVGDWKESIAAMRIRCDNKGIVDVEIQLELIDKFNKEDMEFLKVQVHQSSDGP